MINGVNFGAISTDPTIKLQDATITQTQSNAAPSTPTAATNVQGDSFEKKGGKGKKFVGFLATVAAAATALVILSKRGVIKVTELGENAKKLDVVKNYIGKAGEFLAKKYDDLSASVVKLFKKAKPEDIPPAA